MSGKRRNFSVTYKLAALDFLKTNSVEKTAREFSVDPRRIREWRKSQSDLEELNNSGKGNVKRKEGGGRKVHSEDLEKKLLNWIVEKREQRLRVSRNMIRRKATDFSKEENENGVFVASAGWLDKFLQRNSFVVRRRTTVSQKLPDDYREKIVNYLVYLRQLRVKEGYKDEDIIVMDETPVWLEQVANSTVERKGSKEVPIKSAGHEKVRLTVVLTARADGTKLKPYIIIPRRRPIKELETLTTVVCAYDNKSWMDDSLTIDYLNRVVGKFSFSKRLMIWDSFRCHTSASTRAHLRKLSMASVIIPGGCTGKIQAPDVSWNKSFKSRLSSSYDEWMLNGPHSFTNAGNMRPPSFLQISTWIHEAWKDIPTTQIQSSMKQCGITNSQDGSDDCMIEYLKKNPDAKAIFETKLATHSSVITSNESEEEEDPFAVEDSDISWCDTDESN